MTPPPDFSSLDEAGKDALILAQSEMINGLRDQIAALMIEVAALKAKLSLPPKPPDNSSMPPSQGQKPNRAERRSAARRKGHPGVARALAEHPDEVVEALAEDFLDGAVPEVWVADRYAAQNGHGAQRQVCLAHLPRDTQYAMDEGDKTFAPGPYKRLQDACAIAARRETLKTSTLTAYLSKIEGRLDRLMEETPTSNAGRKRVKSVKACRGDLFIFISRRDVPCTNNVSERHLRPSVIFRKVTGGFRSQWGASTYAAAASVIATGKLRGRSPLDTLRDAGLSST